MCNSSTLEAEAEGSLVRNFRKGERVGGGGRKKEERRRRMKERGRRERKGDEEAKGNAFLECGGVRAPCDFHF